MAMRDPRNKSRNKAPKRTSSSTRSARSKTTAKYNPRPTSSSTRANQPPSKKVTTGKGGSARLNKALDSVKTNPVSKTPRGAQGPRSAPQQGPYQKPPSAIRSGPSAPVKKPTPKAATPKVSNVGSQIKQAKAVKAANPGRAARAARSGNVTPAKVAGTLAGGLKGGVKGLALGTAKKILDSSGTKGAAKMSRLGIGGNAPVTKPKPTKKPLPVDKKPIKAPPKKGSKVLAKKGGKEGVLQNGVFYATGWSPAQRNRYQIQKKKGQK